MTSTDRFTCTLTPHDARQRVQQVQAFAAGLTGWVRENERQAVFVLPVSLAGLVDEFVRDESRCCAFYDFEVERSAEAVRLRVRAPAGADAMLDGLIAALTR